RNCKKQLNEYFKGNEKDFNLRTSPEGTDFQRKSWDAASGNSLWHLPLTYASIGAIGGYQKSEPVGSANGKNPIAIIIPCHRCNRAIG
ncbi:UNVERIFIED_CONTAM: hypothetical protein GTU68_025317, partial [Idotea baltica]|nr:hypothetical protein [Idotea baltica]